MTARASSSFPGFENTAQNGMWSTQVSTVSSWFNIALTPKSFSFIIPNFLYYLKASNEPDEKALVIYSPGHPDGKLMLLVYIF